MLKHYCLSQTRSSCLKVRNHLSAPWVYDLHFILGSYIPSLLSSLKCKSYSSRPFTSDYKDVLTPVSTVFSNFPCIIFQLNFILLCLFKKTELNSSPDWSLRSFVTNRTVGVFSFVSFFFAICLFFPARAVTLPASVPTGRVTQQQCFPSLQVHLGFINERYVCFAMIILMNRLTC